MKFTRPTVRVTLFYSWVCLHYTFAVRSLILRCWTGSYMTILSKSNYRVRLNVNMNIADSISLILFQFWERRLILQTGVGGVSTAPQEKFPTFKTLLFPLSLSLSLSFSLSPSLFTFLFLFPFLRSVFLFSIWSKDVERKKLTSNGSRANTLIYCLSHVNLTFVFQKWYSGSCTWWEATVRDLIFSFEVLGSSKKWSPVERVKHTMYTHQHKFYHCCLPPYSYPSPVRTISASLGCSK